MQKRILLSTFVLSTLLSATGIAAEKAARIGVQIPEFTLRDYLGHEYDLSDFDDAKLLVVTFLGTDCPLVKLYGPKLEELSKKYADDGVVFLGINSNRQDQPTKVGAFARRYGLSFPILKDPNNKIADLFQAARTPEVFVLDENRAVQYRGRIDDQYGFTTGVGYGRPKVTKHELIVAIDQLLAGDKVTEPLTDAPGCLIGRVPKVEPHGDVTYSNQIARILQNSCVECHREGQIGPFPLSNYDEVVGWGEMIREVVETKRMPPWYADPAHGEFSNDMSLNADEKELVHLWVENGMPEGDPKDLPEPLQFSDEWGISEPDVVFFMDDEPYKVQADGVIDYQYFTVETGFTEDRWIKAVQARPGNRAVVHHIIIFLQGADEDEGSGNFRRRGALIGYAPGMQPRVYPDGAGVLIPKGTKLVFQIHYTPVGTEQLDLTSVGMVFAEPGEIKQEVRGGMVGNASFRIPPGDPDYVVKSKHKFRRPILLQSLMPHMHLRGKGFKYEVEYPDGTREVLLDVPEYDFNWQLWYDLAEPKLLPKGTWMYCTAHFDNSEDNVYNPDPTAEVVWGEQTFEEMMFGFYSAVDPNENLLAKKPKQ